MKRGITLRNGSWRPCFQRIACQVTIGEPEVRILEALLTGQMRPIQGCSSQIMKPW